MKGNAISPTAFRRRVDNKSTDQIVRQETSLQHLIRNYGKLDASTYRIPIEGIFVRNSGRLQLIIRMGRPPLEISYGAGPIGSITVAQKLRAPESLPDEIIQRLELLREMDFKSHDSRIRAIIARIFESCPEFETVVISFPGGTVWESRPAEYPCAAAA